MALELPQLPYDVKALEPHIDARTMEIHHTKHHQAYINNANNLLKDHPALAALSAEQLIADLSKIPEAIRGGIRNNAGGHSNHAFFWQIIGPGKGGAPKGALKAAIEASFGSFDKFKEEFTKCALGTFGSGWAWLVKKADGSLDLVSTSNAATPLTTDAKPLLTCDVWEHAYYIDTRNARPKYLDNFWSLVNWDFASKNLA